MLYAGRRVKKPKFEIGDMVAVHDFKFTFGKIGHATYRDAEGATTGWFYKVKSIGGGYQSWPEKALKKLTKAAFKKKEAEFLASGGIPRW